MKQQQDLSMINANVPQLVFEKLMQSLPCVFFLTSRWWLFFI